MNLPRFQWEQGKSRDFASENRKYTETCWPCKTNIFLGEADKETFRVVAAGEGGGAPRSKGNMIWVNCEGAATWLWDTVSSAHLLWEYHS